MTTGQIDRTGELWLYSPDRHKTDELGKVREIPLGPKAQEVLKPWLKADPAAPLFSPIEATERQVSRAAEEPEDSSHPFVAGPEAKAQSAPQAAQALRQELLQAGDRARLPEGRNPGLPAEPDPPFVRDPHPPGVRAGRRTGHAGPLSGRCDPSVRRSEPGNRRPKWHARSADLISSSETRDGFRGGHPGSQADRPDVVAPLPITPRRFGPWQLQGAIMSDHVPSVKTVRLLRRQIGQLLAISETAPLFLSIPDEAHLDQYCAFDARDDAVLSRGQRKGRTTLLWPLFFADALEKVNRLTEGPMRRWGLMGDPPRQKAPKRYALKSDGGAMPQDACCDSRPGRSRA